MIHLQHLCTLCVLLPDLKAGGRTLTYFLSHALNRRYRRTFSVATTFGSSSVIAPIIKTRPFVASTAFVESSQRKLPPTLPDDEPLVTQPVEGASAIAVKEGSSRDGNNRLILIDGKAVVYRAYFKLMTKFQYGTMEDPSGEGDWVLTVFTALSTVLRILELNPSHIVVVFDHDGLTFRHTLFSEYKMNRFPTPDTVRQALRYIKPALLAMGVKTIEVPGVEADDVIGTLAVSAVDAGTKVRVVSPDKDFFQLISNSLRLLRFVPRGSGIVSFGLEEFHARFQNLQPSQFVDVLALMGDKVDNIPGVPGVGEKTAVNLIKLYGSLEKVLEERNNVKGKRALSGLLADNGEVLLGKRLVTLRTDLPYYMVPFSMGDFLYRKPQDGGERYFNLLKAMGSFVNGTFTKSLEKRTEEIWMSYQ